SVPGQGHKIYPYLLRGLAITRQSGVVGRYYVFAAATRLHVPGGGYRLVQSLRAGLAALEHARRPLLSRGTHSRCAFAAPRSSTPIKARSSLPRRSPTAWNQPGSASAWMLVVVRWTIFWSNASGGA